MIKNDKEALKVIRLALRKLNKLEKDLERDIMGLR